MVSDKKIFMGILNCKNVQHVKIYIPCNFEVNPITHFDRICKLEKRGDEINDEKRAITPRWVIKFTSKLLGR
jgi:hypothetical protein